ncbi:MAG TPA: hypothetical protein VFE21_07605 [Rubrobacteraceae bacterium]|nr:hypothetical protein [Rubrobacteraceae bacterium]
MHLRVIASAIGAVVAASGILMLIPTIFSLFANDGTFPVFVAPSVGAIVLGVAVFSFSGSRTATRRPRTYS